MMPKATNCGGGRVQSFDFENKAQLSSSSKYYDWLLECITVSIGNVPGS